MSTESLKCKGVVGCENQARKNEKREGSQFAEKIGQMPPHRPNQEMGSLRCIIFFSFGSSVVIFILATTASRFRAEEWLPRYF